MEWGQAAQFVTYMRIPQLLTELYCWGRFIPNWDKMIIREGQSNACSGRPRRTWSPFKWGAQTVLKHKLCPKTSGVISEQMGKEAGQSYWFTGTQAKVTSTTGHFWERAKYLSSVFYISLILFWSRGIDYVLLTLLWEYYFDSVFKVYLIVYLKGDSESLGQLVYSWQDHNNQHAIA